MIALGDYVDRGPESREVLEWLITRAMAGNLVALRGNHELMMLRAREDKGRFREWVMCGGDATLASYAPRGGGRLADVPAAHWNFLENGTVPWYETESHFFVHANAYPCCSLAEQPESMLYWETFDDPPPHESGKIMVCGHTPQQSGRPRSLGHAVCIDTWVHGLGWLTCLEVGTGRYWQANQYGEWRLGCLVEEG
jgi:serine/threonine protein phosphatase 1